MDKENTIAYEFNIIIGSVTEREIELLFSPWSNPPDENDKIISMPLETRWPNLLKEIGVFKSTSQARKNGWNRDIPNGWNEVKVGRKFIYVFKKEK